MTNDNHLEPLAQTSDTVPAPLSPKQLSCVVGIGGSAGALDGYERFFLNLPAGGGMAFVVTPHLDPQHRGLMPEILRRCTLLPVNAIEDGIEVEPDCVYVLPPGHSLTIMHGRLLLDDLDRARGKVIDTFFESLASDQGERAVGVILSGMGDDGSRGVRAIKEQFGTVLIQDPRTAEYPSMPHNAATQLDSEVFPAEEIGPRLYGLVTSLPALDEAATERGAPLQKILRLIRSHTGHDFSQYKRSTLVRRVDRRMKLHRVRDVAQYVRFLQDTPAEQDALFQDFTINVTSFFRDPEAFDELKDVFRGVIAATKRDGDEIRVWVAGCATGEEAYSVAMVMRELAEEFADRLSLKIQIFATDIDGAALEHARYGLYGQGTAYVVSPERLALHFQPRDGGFQVRAEVRDLVIFAIHNTFGDPPFTRLDLLSFRNVLIYLGVDLQRQVLALFHYALRPQGLLFLGASESVGTGREGFTPLNLRWKIFRRGEGHPGSLPLSGSLMDRQTINAESIAVNSLRGPDLAQQVQQLLAAEYAPPAVVIGAQGEILFVSGRTAHYLELPNGRAAMNAFEMGRGSLRYEIPAVARQALAVQQEVRRSGIQLEIDGTPHLIDLVATPLRDTQLLLVFVDHLVEGPTTVPVMNDQLFALERELRLNREFLRSNIEEAAVSFEELRSINEELQTTNEELQSSNEELTTSKEELQSLNEELITINSEHQRVIQDLAQINDDMKNLLDSAGIATVFLSDKLLVRRFTPRITKVLNLMPVDIGRSITDLSLNLNYQNLTRDIGRVLDTLEVFEEQVETLDHCWYLMRISPYRTSDNFIDGVVIAFTNIDLIKKMEQQLHDSLTLSDTVLNAIHDPVVVFNADLIIVATNRAFQNLFRMPAARLQGERLTDVANFALDQPDLMMRIDEMMRTDVPLVNYVIDLTLPHLGARKMKTEAESVVDEQPAPLFVLKLEDVTDLIDRAATGQNVQGDNRS